MRRSHPLSRLLLCALLVALVGAADVRAQDGGDGTVYSRFGVGELQTFGSPQIEALGGRGTALHSPNYINVRNPASWSSQQLVRVAAGAHYQSLRASVADESTSTLTSGSLNAVHFGVPLLGNRLGIAFGFSPFSRASYLAQRTGREITELGDTLDFTVNTEGRGGLQQIVGGAGLRITDNLRIGGSLHFVFGILEDATETRFEDPAVFGTDLVDATRVFGVTGTLGAIYSSSGLMGDHDQLSVGTAVTLPTRLNGEQVRTLRGRRAATRDTLGSVVDGSVRIPVSARAGVTYRPDARWLLLIDGEYEPWTQFENTFAATEARFLDPENYQDRWRASAGVEFLPAGNDPITSFFERTSYRLGGYVEQAYVTPEASVKLRTLAATGGLSLPTMVSGTRIDLNVEVGTRGTTDHNLVRDVYYRVSLNVNIGERWFRERRYR